MFGLVDRLREEGSLSDPELLRLLEGCDAPTLDYLCAAARAVAQTHFGRNIFVRGLIEAGNICRNDCLYCGIRRSNRTAERYRLSPGQIVACCEAGHALGMRTFVLQGGEDGWWTDRRLEQLLRTITERWPECAVTLSLGERPRESYRRLRTAGASRYLLRHETADAAHYARLHPAAMSHARRMQCLDDLRAEGFQVGAGMMVGSPGQRPEHLLADLRLLERLRPAMVGIGPFLPHAATPFARERAGSLEETLLVLALVRLMHPAALIPATTALASRSPEGRLRGILAGANVVMPNLSPASVRRKYALYDNKAAFGSEAAEGLAELSSELAAAGYRLDFGRGDYKPINDHGTSL